MAFIAWTEIESFHNIRKFVRVDPAEWWAAKEKFSGTSVVKYKAKIKLHGTNAAVQILADGTVLAQSRTNIITPENDNAGFARWVKETESHWKNYNDNARAQVIVHGEWIGPGIQKGVAVNQIPKKSFAVFAARPLSLDGTPQDDTLWVEPSILEEIVYGIPDTYILPWYNRPAAYDSDTRVNVKLEIDWKKSDQELTELIIPVNNWVDEVETSDPWVKDTFDVKGTGEGLVFYPVSTPHLGYESFSYLTFKAKGEAHKNIKSAKPAQVAPEIANSISDFAILVLTPARLNQGVKAVGSEINIKLTGQFVNWVLKDVEKETQDELEASNLTWKQVQKAISERARTWYIEQSKR
jgi:hypothetical protein